MDSDISLSDPYVAKFVSCFTTPDASWEADSTQALEEIMV
jgi:hypothetical protein